MTGAAGSTPDAGVADYVAAITKCSPTDVVHIRRFPAGNRHRVYLVEYRGRHEELEQLVVRIGLDGSPADVAQAEFEAEVLAWLGGSFAPKLYDFRPRSSWFEGPVSCSEFVAGHGVDLGRCPPHEMEELARALSRLHCYPTGGLSIPDPGVGGYAERRVTEILSQQQWVRPPLPPELQVRLLSVLDAVRRRSIAVMSKALFADPAGLSLLHGDVAAGNVLWRAGPILIDWEYARLGDPADELAYLFDQNGLPPLRREAFWSAYASASDGPGPVDGLRQRAEWWRPLVLLGSTLWWAQRWVQRVELQAANSQRGSDDRGDQVYREALEQRLVRLENLLKVH